MSTIISLLARLGMDNSGFRRGAEEASKATSQLQQDMASLAKIGKGMATVGGALTAGVTTPLIALGAKATMTAARVDSLDLVVRTLGKNANYTEAEVDEFVKSVESMGIEASSSREIIAKYITAQLDLADASAIARVAQDQAVISGENSTETMERLTDAILSGSVIMFRTLRMSVDLDKAYQDMALTLGKTTEELSDMEKVQARVNAVLEYGSVVQGTYESAMEDSYKQMGSFKRYINDIFVALGQHFTPALNQVVFGLADFLKWLKTSVVAGGSFYDILQKVGKELESVGKFLAETLRWFKDLPSWVHQATLKLVLFVAAIGPLLTVGGGLLMLLPKITAGLGTLGITFTTSLAAVAPYVVAIGALVAGLTALSIKAKSAREEMTKEMQTTAEGAESYANYRRILEDTARSKGFMVTATGALIGYQGALIDENYVMTETQWEAKQSIDAMSESMEEASLAFEVYNFRTGEAIDFTDSYAEALDRMYERNERDLSMTLTLTKHNQEYTEQMEEVRESIGTVTDELLELYGQQSLTLAQREKVDELKGAYGALTGDVLALQEAHREATNQMIFDLLMQSASVGGLSSVELEMLVGIGEGFGIIDEGMAGAAVSLNDLLVGVEEGIIEPTEAFGEMQTIIQGLETDAGSTKSVFDNMLTQLKEDGGITVEDIGTIQNILKDMPGEAGSTQSALDSMLTEIKADGEVTEEELRLIDEFILSIEDGAGTAQTVLDTMLKEIKSDGDITETELRNIDAILSSIYEDSNITQEAYDTILDGLVGDASNASVDITNVDTVLNRLNGKTFTTTLDVIINDLTGIPGRASGGSVLAGSPYIVGERGAEVYVPKQDGYVVPNDELDNYLAGSKVENHYHLTANYPMQSEITLIQELKLREALA